jgi:RimJ/RimL family protein N-acetyltransferase
MICTNKSHPVVLTADIPDQAREWRNDREINRWCRQDGLISGESQISWIDKIELDPAIRMFGVYDLKKPIGVAGLTSIDRQNRSAEFSLYIAPEHQKKGYGVKALDLLLYHGFEDMGLNRIWGEVFVGNPAIHMFHNLGFKTEGCQRETYWKHGEFIDSHTVSMLAREFKV